MYLLNADLGDLVEGEQKGSDDWGDQVDKSGYCIIYNCNLLYFTTLYITVIYCTVLYYILL